MPHQIRTRAQKIAGVSADEPIKEMNQASSPNDDGDSDESTANCIENAPHKTLDGMIDQNLSHQFTFATAQLEVVQTVRNYLQHLGPHYKRTSCPPEPIKMLVTGMPGTGKSFVIEHICYLVRWFQSGHVAMMALNGIAAVNIDGATLCSLLSIKKGKTLQPLSASKVTELNKTLQMDRLCLLVIDEVSNVDAFMMAAIGIRLRQLRGNDRTSFGGLVVLFFGDFSQLPPVKSVSLTFSLMQIVSLQNQTTDTPGYNANVNNSSTVAVTTIPTESSPEPAAPLEQNTGKRVWQRTTKKRKALAAVQGEHAKAKQSKKLNRYGQYGAPSLPRRGAELFTTFHRIHLTDQKRAKDKEHLGFLKRMSRGEQISMHDLRRYGRLPREDLHSSEAGEALPDNKSPKVSWKYAPVLVSSNRERIDIVYRKTLLSAKDHGTYVFGWKTDIGEWKNMSLIVPDRLDLHNSDPCFWQYFVAGADGFLTTNLNNNLGLTNETPHAPTGTSTHAC